MGYGPVYDFYEDVREAVRRTGRLKPAGGIVYPAILRDIHVRADAQPPPSGAQATGKCYGPSNTVGRESSATDPSRSREVAEDAAPCVLPWEEEGSPSSRWETLAIG